MPSPITVLWTDHALAKAEHLGIARADIESAVLAGHAQRRRNAGAADWRVDADRLAVIYNHPDAGDPIYCTSGHILASAVASLTMKIDGHYDAEADIAWLRFEGYDAATVVSEEVESGLRELDPQSGRTVGLEYWDASASLPAELLRMLPPPQLNVAA